MSTRVLVTDGDQRAALALVRALGSDGYACLVASSHARPLAGASRHAQETHRVPDPVADRGAFIEALRTITRDRGVAVLLPVTEATLRVVLGCRDAFDDVRIPFPAGEAFAAVSDKSVVLAEARRVGIPVPRQVLVEAPDDRAALEGTPPAFPVAVKPSRSAPAAPGTWSQAPVRYASDAKGLEAALRGFPAAHYPVLVQSRIDGPGSGLFLLRWNGRIVARFAHRRLREKPPSGGVSVLSESIAVDPRLLEWSVALLERFDWQGVAMVEYKQDAATGTPYLMEVNGRFWGSLQLAVDAGVNFPLLLVRAALGDLPEAAPRYREGVRLRWFWGDVDHLIARMRDPGSAGRLRAVGAFVSGFQPGNRAEVCRLRDLRPFLRESMNWAGAALR